MRIDWESTMLSSARTKIFREVYERLYDEHGFVSYQMLVDEARSPRSELHEGFGWEWDLTKAAMKHWLAHAGALVRSVRIRVVDKSDALSPKQVKIRALRPMEKEGRRTIEETITVLSDDEMRTSYLLEIKEQVDRMVRKLEETKWAADVVVKLSELRDMLDDAA